MEKKNITRQEIMERLNRIENDAVCIAFSNGIEFYVTIENVCFDENWHESDREYEEPEKVNEFLKWIEENGKLMDELWHKYYAIGDYKIHVCWESENC